MERRHWIPDENGHVQMTRGGYPHRIHVSQLDAIRDGRAVASCFQECMAAHDQPLPPGYTGHGKSGRSAPPKHAPAPAPAPAQAPDLVRALF